MGRGILIYVTLVTVVMGYVITRTQNKRMSITRGNVNSYENVQSHNAAVSGLGLAMQQFDKMDYDYSSVSNPLNFSIGESSVEVQFYNTDNSDLRYNQLQLISTATLGNANNEVTGMYNSGYPTPRAAMGFYGNNDVDFKTSGNSFLIDGNDNVSNKPSMPGIMAEGNNSYNDILSGIPSKREDNIIGTGGIPSVQNDQRMDANEVLDLLSGWIANRTRMIGEYGVSGDESHKFNGVTWGTTSNPEITVIRDDTELRGGSSGAGIMIIQDDAVLDMGSNFEYEGLIINNSDNVIFDAQGTPQLRGAMMSIPACGTSSSDCQTSVDFRGNVQVQYDSHALYKMQEGLTPSTNDYNYSQVNLYE